MAEPATGVHPIALDALEAHTLVVGTTGSGKTYMLRGLLEQLRRADRRVAAIDKMGNLWGVTNSTDGQAAGLEFVIFGGKRAHVPMTPADGAKLGRLFAERGFPAIFDVSQWKRHDQEAWVADFADALFETNALSTHLLLDEAQSWVPQGGGGDAFRAVLRLAEQGRGNGIHLLIAVQRMARLDATVRSMMQGLTIAMKQITLLDRKAVRDHVAGDATALYAGLPGLPAGTGFICDPAAVSIERVTFPRNTTFDSSRTPRHGDTPPTPIAMSSGLVDELRRALAPAAATEALPDDTIPSDPGAAYAKGSAVGGMIVEHHARILELETENAGLRGQIDDLDETCQGYSDILGRLDALIQQMRDALSGVAVPAVETARAPKAPAQPVEISALVTKQDTTPVPEAQAALAPRRRKILEAIAWSATYLCRPSVARGIVAWIAGTSPSSSTFERDLGAMRSAGLIDYPARGEVALTEAGAGIAPSSRRPQGRDALWLAIAARLPPRRVRIVEALWDGRACPRDVLAERLATSANSSTFERDLGAMRMLDLVDYPGPGSVILGKLLQ